ncbi:hypothetical protein [Halomicrococcus gelatinilyticus]|uniref:hypothetical protein n=1 Tax=Halomicrococcus gelatinilyticus TaxID=1702103 RepID=UPI002E0E6E5A
MTTSERTVTPRRVAAVGLALLGGYAVVRPWLVQMGAARGGLYSYDWLDVVFGVLDAPSADELLPEHQHLDAGETIPLGGGDLLVETVAPERALVTVPEAFPGGKLTWVFALEPLPGGRTRLLTRNRARVEWSPRWPALLALIELPAFLMTRKMLLGVKRRAEGVASPHRSEG